MPVGQFRAAWISFTRKFSFEFTAYNQGLRFIVSFLWSSQLSLFKVNCSVDIPRFDAESLVRLPSGSGLIDPSSLVEYGKVIIWLLLLLLFPGYYYQCGYYFLLLAWFSGPPLSQSDLRQWSSCTIKNKK